MEVLYLNRIRPYVPATPAQQVARLGCEEVGRTGWRRSPALPEMRKFNAFFIDALIAPRYKTLRMRDSTYFTNQDVA